MWLTSAERQALFMAAILEYRAKLARDVLAHGPLWATRDGRVIYPREHEMLVETRRALRDAHAARDVLVAQRKALRPLRAPALRAAVTNAYWL